jgi:hypothetical protein
MYASSSVLRLRQGRTRRGYPRAGVAEFLTDGVQGPAVLGLLLGHDGSLRGVVLCDPRRTWSWGSTEETHPHTGYVLELAMQLEDQTFTFGARTD